MLFSINREKLLNVLQLAFGAIDRKHNMPILSNFYIQVYDDELIIIGTDLEVELLGKTTLSGYKENGHTTVPAKKLLDICKSLSNNAEIKIELVNERLIIHSERSRFSLSTLTPEEFPKISNWHADIEFSLSKSVLKSLIYATQFSMAHQDVRRHFNGMLFQIDNSELRTVTTDGHRLSMSVQKIQGEMSYRHVIVPRKAVVEMSRLLDNDLSVTVLMNKSSIRLSTEYTVFTSKLIEGKFPDYNRVFPKDGDKIVIANRKELKQAFSRVSILSNEKFRGVRLKISKNSFTISANNPEQEEAVVIIDVDYDDDALEIGFNVSYVLDVLNTLKGDFVKMTFGGPISSVLFEDVKDNTALYVIMPMRL